MSMLNMVGDFIRLKRLEQRQTLEQVADKVGVSINYISKLEKGDVKNPSDDIIIKLSQALGLNEDELFQGFGQIPLKTRQILFKHPELSKTIASISKDKRLSDEKKAEYTQRAIRWYEKLLNE